MRRTPAAGVGGRALTLVVNLGEEAAPLPDGELLLATAPLVGGCSRASLRVSSPDRGRSGG
nr:DUF3459 domain-containing protein [Tessaracoccus coleopterorum]